MGHFNERCVRCFSRFWQYVHCSHSSPTVTWLFISDLPCGTSRIGCLSERNNKSTNSWRNKSCNSNWWRQSISYGMDYGLKWHPQQQQNHPAVSETHLNHDTDGRTSEPRWDLKKSEFRGAESGSKMDENGKGGICFVFFQYTGILNVKSSGTSDSSDICRDIIYNLYSIQHKY